MPWVTEEEIQAAKNMTAYEYLRTHQAQRLQKTRTRNEWQLTDHDSFKINELSSKWHWKSRDIGPCGKHYLKSFSISSSFIVESTTLPSGV